MSAKRKDEVKATNLDHDIWRHNIMPDERKKLGDESF